MAEGDNPILSGPHTLAQALEARAISKEAPAEAEDATAEEAPVDAEGYEAEATEDPEHDAEGAEEADPDVEEPDDDEADADQILSLDEYGDVKVETADGVKTLREIASDHLKQSDYTRKTQELARERSRLEAQAREAMARIAEKEREYDALILRAQGDEPEPDWEKRFEEDPFEAPREKAVWEARQKKRQAERSAAEARRQQALENTRGFTASKAIEIFPEWKDPDKFMKSEPKRRELALRAGFHEQEYENLKFTDFRFATLLEMALKADHAQRKGKAALQKMAKQPKAKVLKPGRQRSAKETEAVKDDARKAILNRPHTLAEHLAAIGAKP